MHRYWYHVSPDWTEGTLLVNPRHVREDDNLIGNPCICVAPTPEQALLAIGDFYSNDEYGIYRTQGDPLPHDAFDFELTEEHRFFKPMMFQRVGSIVVNQLMLPQLDMCAVPDDVILKNGKILLAMLKDKIIY